MADLTSFSSSTYECTDWINDALRDVPAEESVESYLSSLTMKLHIMSQDYTDQLETSMVESMTAMPRLLSDITRLEEQLKDVQTEMQSLSNQLNAFDQRNVVGVEDLSRLDTLKANMEECKATLEEHARWSQLVREAKNLLEGGGRLSDSADRVEIMFKSLEILKNLPGNEERQSTCDSFKESLLSAVRPRLQRDVAGDDLTPLQEYFYVFQKLDRETELETEYVTARPAKALQLWYSYEPNEHESFAKWLALYLGKVARLVSEEQDNTTFLFGHSKGTKVLSSIIKEATNPLQSSLCDRLSNFSTPEIPFDCYCVTDEFSRRVFAMLNDLDEQQYGDVLRSIYGGFYQFLESYGNCEEFYIRNHLQEILDNVSFEGGESLLEDRQKDNFLASDDSSDCYSMFGERAIAATDSFQVPVEFCIKRCISFMGGLRVKPVMRMLGTVLALFVRLLTAKVDELSVACGFARELSPIPQISTGSSAMPQSVADSLALKLETNDVDSRLLIMSALRALQAAGRFSRNFKVLEQFTKNTMIELDSTLFRKSSLTSFVLESRNNNRSLGQAYASFLQENDTSISSELKSFLIASSSTSQHLAQSVFSAVYTPLAKFKSMAGTLLFNLCIEAPDKMIAGLSNETVWQLQSSDGDSTATDLKESMLPQSVVTQVGEHMLSLVQELEAFASSDALVDLLVLKGEAQPLVASSSGWISLKSLLGMKENEGIDIMCGRVKSSNLITSVETNMFGSTSAVPYIEIDHMDAYDPSSNVDTDGDTSNAVLSFVNEWLSAISDAVVGLLIVQIFQIPFLSLAGCTQLATDVEYLSNVINAMGIRPHPLLQHLQQILLCEVQSLAHIVEAIQAKAEGSNVLLRFDHKLINAILKVNGIDVNE